MGIGIRASRMDLDPWNGQTAEFIQAATSSGSYMARENVIGLMGRVMKEIILMEREMDLGF